MKHPRIHLLSLTLLLCAATLAATALRAETHALIMTIGDYAEPSARLKGGAADARMARDLMVSLGATNILPALADRQLNFFRLRDAVQSLQARVRPDDVLVIYYSGHAKRRKGVGAGCEVALVSADGRFYPDASFQADLEALARVAKRLVVFNDSCHAAGAVAQTKGFSLGDDELQVKAYPDDLDDTALPKNSDAAKAQANVDDDCARISNISSKAFGLSGPEDRITYLAAAAPDEVAWSGPDGSLATRAWRTCMADPDARADSNGDGQLNGRELATCANRVIKTQFPRWRQTVTSLFNVDLPLMRAPRRGTR